VKGVLATPAPATIMEDQIREYLTFMPELKKILPSRIVDLIEAQERCYEDRMGSVMCEEHGYFINEILLRSYVVIGDIPLWSEVVTKDFKVNISYPLGIMDPLITDCDPIEVVEIDPTNILYYALDTHYIASRFLDEDKVIIYNSCTDMFNEYDLPSIVNSCQRGYSVVHHSPSMYPQYIYHGIECIELVRVLIFKDKKGYKTVFDYGGFKYDRDCAYIFSAYRGKLNVTVAGKLSLEEVRTDPSPSIFSHRLSHHYRSVNKYGILYTDCGFSLKCFNIDVSLIVCEIEPDIEGCWRSQRHCYYDIVKGDFRFRAKSYHEMERYITQTIDDLLGKVKKKVLQSGFLPRLIGIEPNPGPHKNDIIYCTLWFLLIVFMVSCSSLLYLCVDQYMFLIAIIGCSSIFFWALSVIYLFCCHVCQGNLVYGGS